MYSQNISKIGDNCAGHYQLAENITVSTSDGFPLCNNSSQPFNGTLKSDGYLISGLNVTNPGGNAGMFGYMSGARVDVHLVNPVAKGEHAGAVAAHMLSDNEVNATFYGGDIKGTGAAGVAGGMAAQVNGHRNRLQQTGGNTDRLKISARGTEEFILQQPDAGGGIGQQAGVNNTLIQNQLWLEVVAGRNAGGGFGMVSNSQDTVLSQSKQRICVFGTGNVGGGIGHLDRSDRTTLSQYEGEMNVTAHALSLFSSAGGGVGFVDNADNTAMSQDGVQMNVTARWHAGGGGGGCAHGREHHPVAE